MCEYLSGGARFLLHPDELLFISPGTVHTMICPEDSESYERLILQINADFMTQVLELYRLDGSKLPPLYILRAESVCRWGLRELVERINASASVTDADLREQLYRCQIGELMLTVKHIARASKSVVPNASSTLVSGVAKKANKSEYYYVGTNAAAQTSMASATDTSNNHIWEVSGSSLVIYNTAGSDANASDGEKTRVTSANGTDIMDYKYVKPLLTDNNGIIYIIRDMNGLSLQRYVFS